MYVKLENLWCHNQLSSWIILSCINEKSRTFSILDNHIKVNRNPLWTNTLICLFTKGESCTLQSHVCIHVLDCVMNSGPRGISIWIMQYWDPYSVMVSTGRQRINSVSSNITYTYQVWINTSEIFFHFWQFNGILFSWWNNLPFNIII